MQRPGAETQEHLGKRSVMGDVTLLKEHVTGQRVLNEQQWLPQCGCSAQIRAGSAGAPVSGSEFHSVAVQQCSKLGWLLWNRLGKPAGAQGGRVDMDPEPEALAVILFRLPAPSGVGFHSQRARLRALKLLLSPEAHDVVCITLSSNTYLCMTCYRVHEAR